MGDPGTSPEVTDQKIWFNGAGDDSCETFCLNRVRPPKQAHHERRGWDFCKTARRPYDLAVTAALCYLATVTDPISHSVSSDGHGRDYLDGLEEARRALPRYANILDIPMDILRKDRWCMPWVRTYESSGFDVKFCVDGKGYVEHIKTGDWYCFETHLALAQFLDKTKEVKFPRRLKVRFGHHVETSETSSRTSGTRTAASMRLAISGSRQRRPLLWPRCSTAATPRTRPITGR